MRILIWSGSYAPGVGGVEVVTHGLARGLAAGGHVVQVVTQSFGSHAGTEHAPEGLVHRLPFHEALASRDPSRVALLTRETARVLAELSPDVVHAHAFHPSEYFLLRALNGSSCRLVFTLHGWTPLAPGRHTLRERILRRADWVTGCSQDTVNQVRRHLPEIASRTVTVLNGCPDPGVAIAPLWFDPPHVLAIGRLVEAKGFDDLLRAIAAIRRGHPAARLTIAGDGPHREALERESVRLGLADCTHFPGALARHEVWDAINRATLVVVPSRAPEGLGLAALEAGLMERPVVATRNGGLAEAVVDGRTGFLVQSGHPEDLARSVIHLLDDRALAVRLGRAGRVHVLNRFGWDAQMAAYQRLYETWQEGDGEA